MHFNIDRILHMTMIQYLLTKHHQQLVVARLILTSCFSFLLLISIFLDRIFWSWLAVSLFVFFFFSVYCSRETQKLKLCPQIHICSTDLSTNILRIFMSMSAQCTYDMWYNWKQLENIQRISICTMYGVHYTLYVLIHILWWRIADPTINLHEHVNMRALRKWIWI